MERKKNPWLGFMTYRESDASTFVGRNEDIAALVEQIRHNDLLVLYANSGTGKSSVINAGLCPRLRSNRYFPIYIRCDEYEDASKFDQTIIQWFSSPEKLARLWSVKEPILLGHSCVDVAPAEVSSSVSGFRFKSNFESDESSLLCRLDERLASSSLWWFMRTHSLVLEMGAGMEIAYTPLLIFDQFEEFFDKTSSAENALAFFDWYNRLVSPMVPAEVQFLYHEMTATLPVSQQKSIPSELTFKSLFSLRKDYMGQLDYWTYQRSETRNSDFVHNRYYLRPLQQSQAIEVIDLGRGRLQNHKEKILEYVQEHEGYPAILLSVICHELYDQVSQSSDLTEDRVRNILRSAYERSIMETGLSESQQEQLEDALVDKDNCHRLRKHRSHFRFISSIQMQMLEEKHIIASVGDDYVELIHDKVAEVVADLINSRNERKFVEQQNEAICKQNKRNTILRRVILLFTLLLCGFIAFMLAYSPTMFFDFNHTNAYAPAAIAEGDAAQLVELNNANYYRINTAKDAGGKIKYTWSFGLPLSRFQICSDEKYADVMCSRNHKVNRIDFIGDSIICCGLFFDDCNNAIVVSLPQHCDSLRIANYLKDLKLNFIVDPRNKAIVWENGILWNVRKQRILYARADADSIILFPNGLENVEKIEYTENEGTLLPVQKRLFYNRACIASQLDVIVHEDTLIGVRGVLPASGVLDLRQYSSVKVIADEAFENNDTIVRVYLPLSTTHIGSKAFNCCSSLEYVNFEQLCNLEYIGGYAFLACNRLSGSFDFMHDIWMDEYAFSSKNIDSVHFPSIIYLAPDNDFTELKKVFLPDSINEEGITSLQQTNTWIGSKSKVADNRFIVPCRYDFSSTSSFYRDEDGIIRHRYFKDVELYGEYKGCFKGDSIVPMYEEYISHDPYSFRLHESLYMRENGAIFNYSTENDSIIFIPALSSNSSLEFLNLPAALKELHVPYVYGFSANVHNISYYGLPDSIMSKIDLFVPKGSLSNYLENPDFAYFHSIQEDSLMSRIRNIVEFYFYHLVIWLRLHTWAFYVTILILILAMSILVYNIILILVKNGMSLCSAILQTGIQAGLFVPIFALIFAVMYFASAVVCDIVPICFVFSVLMSALMTWFMLPLQLKK